MAKVVISFTKTELKLFEDFLTYNSMVAMENASINSSDPDEIKFAKQMNPVFTKVEEAIRKAKKP